MEKICLVTIHTIPNYGSVLQTWASQKILQKYCNHVEVIDYWRSNHRTEVLLAKSIENSGHWNNNRIKRFIYRTVRSYSLNKQRMVFDKFLREKINLTPSRYYSEEELEQNLPEADAYITGSDQMWNSEANEGIEYPYFLKFTPDSAKKISYSTSFGKEILDRWEIEETKKLLLRYSYLSVRELSGVQILKDLGFKEGVCVLDPTLVITKSEWAEFSAKRIVKNRYVFLYQLNGNDNRPNKYAEQLAKEKGLQLVRIAYNISTLRKSGKSILLPTPEEFVSLVMNADYVVTDSFHCTAFSINLNKQFMVFYPRKFSTRLKSILRLTNLEDRVVKIESDLSLANHVIDFKEINKVLTVERKKSIEFLERALLQ